MPLTKKDLKQIKDVVVEATEPYFTAIKQDFNNVEDRFDKIDEKFKQIDSNFTEIKNKLSSLERRIIAIEDIVTEHGKELRKIKKILLCLQKQERVKAEKIVSLERRVARLEAMAA